MRILKNFEFDRLNGKEFNGEEWLALAIGNSRLHWAWFQNSALLSTWDTPHITAETATLQNVQRSPDRDFSDLPLYIASVVPAQTALWQTHSQARLLTLNQIPLKQLYPTLGIDRALALWGAATRCGLPALVIDGGTALTFSGANAKQEFVGGAILPGIMLQRQSLSTQTAALPLVEPETDLPPRWANTTEAAIQSGILYSVLAGVQSFIVDWQQTFGQGAIVLTGGDAPLLMKGLQLQFPELAQKITIDLHLIFWGMQAIVEQTYRS